ALSVRTREAGLLTVVSARCRDGAPSRRPAGEGRGATGRDAPAGGARLAVTALPRDAPHPGDLEREAPGRERGRGAARAADARLRRDRARVLTGVSPLTAVATSSACPASPGE